MNNIFGRIVTLRDVRNAVVQFLARWVPTYVGALEHQTQLPPGTVPMPPDPNLSYRGGIDFDTWMPAWSPIFIAVVNPLGKPLRVDGGGAYIQAFDAQVGCNLQYDGNQAPPLGEFEEDSAIQYADILGMAACAAMLQQGAIGVWPDGSPVSRATRLLQYPITSFPYPAEESGRRVCRSRFGVVLDVVNVVIESEGPSAPMSNPYADAPDWPRVQSHGSKIIAEPLTTPVPPPPNNPFVKPS